MNANFNLKCVPVAISLLLNNEEEESEIVVDPSLQAITNMRQSYTHKLFAVVDVPKEEFIYSSMQSLNWSKASPANQNALKLD